MSAKHKRAVASATDKGAKGHVPANRTTTDSVSVARTPEERAVLRIETDLLSRLKTRTTKDGAVYVLDLRTAKYAGIPSTRMTLRNPQHHGWPAEGETTQDAATATAWIKNRYAAWLLRETALRCSSPDNSMITVGEAVRRLIEKLESQNVDANGAPRGKVLPKDKSLASMLTCHVAGLLGDRILTALDGDTVHRTLNGLIVTVTDKCTGKKVKKEAEPLTKRRFKSALARVWKSVFPTTLAPFHEAAVEWPVVIRARSTEVRGFEDHNAFVEEESNGALEPSEILCALAAAMYVDELNAKRPTTRNASVPNTPHTMAIQIATGTRISEVTDVRWGHVFETPHKHMRIHSAKAAHTNIPIRVVPTQVSLEPWLTDLAAQGKGSRRANEFMIRTNPKADIFTQATTVTLGSRVSDALLLADLKVAGKATHGMRATFASICAASFEIDAKMLCLYLGHDSIPPGTSTNGYIKQLKEMMKDSHRSLIDLPSPDEVRAELERRRSQFDAAWPSVPARRKAAKGGGEK